MTHEPYTAPTTEIHASDRPTNLGEGTRALAEFACRADALSRSLDQLDKLAGADGARAVSRLRAQLDGFEPAVTVLGQVKSGKTTLINALAGWADLLPSDVNPWTSVVTSLHLSPGREGGQTSARFTFMSAGEWDRLAQRGGRMGEMAGRAGADGELARIRQQIDAMREISRQRLGSKFELLMGQTHDYGYFDKNLLERYICLGDDFTAASEAAEWQGRFADITKSADLFLTCRTLPYRLCLRDTPGVNDTFLMREQVTINAVRNSRICVVVLSAGQALSSVDMGLIRLVSNLRSRDVILFVNRIDELSDPARQVPEIEASIRQTLADHNGPTDAEIVFGSAFWANKVLSGELEDMGKGSTASLIGWAEVALRAGGADPDAQNMVWQLSGIPALFKALSARIVEDLGAPLLARVSRSALTLAGGLRVAQTLTIDGAGPIESVAREQLPDHLARIRKDARAQLEEDIGGVLAEFEQRAGRAREMFVDRATHALIEHLEIYGDESVWDYDPTGLRMMLRSAYSAMARRLSSTAQARLDTALSDVARLLHGGFGRAIDGVQIAPPTLPDIPPPVVLGHTIALDFSDGWWVTWWRRTRGYKAFAAKFRGLIMDETEDFLTQVTIGQTGRIQQDLLAAFDQFFDEQADLLAALLSAEQGGSDLSGIGAGRDLHDSLERTLDTFRRYAA